MSGESQGAATEKGSHADLSMPQILLGYGETFDALHMILESAPPVAVEYNAKRILKMIADALERDPAVPARDEVREFFARNVRDSPRNDAGATNVPPEAMERLVDELAKLTYESSRPDGETWLPRFSIAMYRAGVRPRPESLVAEILVVMAVSAFHTLLASVARTVFLLNPGRLSGGKEFSLGDILDLGSLDRVVEVAIQRKVDSFLREDLAFWANWYREKGGYQVDFASLAMSWLAVQEIHKRRNAIVHTSGRVNADYAASVADAPPIGGRLETNAKYASAALEELLALGTLIAASVWRPEDHGDETYLAFVSLIADQAENRGSHRVTRKLLRFVRTNTSRMEHRFWAGMGEWRCRLSLGERAEVEAEATRALTAERNPIRRAAIHELVGDIPASIDELVDALADGSIQLDEIHSSELLGDVKRDSRFVRSDED